MYISERSLSISMCALGSVPLDLRIVEDDRRCPVLRLDRRRSPRRDEPDRLVVALRVLHPTPRSPPALIPIHVDVPLRSVRSPSHPRRSRRDSGRPRSHVSHPTSLCREVGVLLLFGASLSTLAEESNLRSDDDSRVLGQVFGGEVLEVGIASFWSAGHVERRSGGGGGEGRSRGS